MPLIGWRSREVSPRPGSGLLDLESDWLEGVRAEQAGVAADDVAVDVVGDNECQFGAGVSEGALQGSCLQHTEQEVDVAADEPVPVVVDRPDMGGCTQLNSGGLTRDMIMTTDQDAKPFGQRIDNACAGDAGRHDDQHAVTTVFVKAAGPGNTRTVEGLFEQPVELLVQVQADVIVAVRSSESGDVNGKNGAHLPISWRGRRPAGWARHSASAGEAGAVRPAAVFLSSAQKLLETVASCMVHLLPGR
jgi:hypothetical protein